MQILKVVADGISLFKNGIHLNFCTQQRVLDDDKEELNHLFSNVYLNPTNCFIGINASGKTSILKFFLLVLEILNSERINDAPNKEIIVLAKTIDLQVYFYLEDKKEVCLLSSVITCVKTLSGIAKYIFSSEKLFSKKVNTLLSRKNLFEFSDKNLEIERKEGNIILNHEKSSGELILPRDLSVIMIKTRNEEFDNVDKFEPTITFSEMLELNNINILEENFITHLPSNILKCIVSFLDPTIEIFEIIEKNRQKTINLKFKDSAQMVINDIRALNKVLSSGTIKGLNIFISAINILKNGGYFIIDEIENHFNNEIVKTFIRFFKENTTNKNGANLLFSTHNPELLDEFNRNDSIFITQNIEGLRVTNFSELLKRNDVKKSEVYMSSFVGRTAPTYDAYINLKSEIKSFI